MHIESSKFKLLFFTLLSLVFVALGFWLLSDAEGIAERGSRSLLRNPTIVRAVGAASILFFGAGFFLFLKRLFSKKEGLTLSAEGIQNDTSFANVFVSWKDVTDIQTMQIHRTKLIGIYVSNPEEYMEKQQGAWRKKLMRMNFNSYGTPIWIATNTLREKHEKVEGLLNEYWKKASFA